MRLQEDMKQDMYTHMQFIYTIKYSQNFGMLYFESNSFRYVQVSAKCFFFFFQLKTHR